MIVPQIPLKASAVLRECNSQSAKRLGEKLVNESKVENSETKKLLFPSFSNSDFSNFPYTEILKLREMNLGGTCYQF